MSAPTIRRATSEDEAIQALSLTHTLGWAVSINTPLLVFRTKPNVIFILCTNEGTRGLITVAIYPNSTAFLGEFVVHPSYQRKGFGGKLFAAALDHLSSLGIKSIGLDAVHDQIPTYERRGFVQSEHVVKVYERRQTIDDVKAQPEEVVKIRDVDLSSLVEYDQRCTGLSREALWTTLLSLEDVEGWVVLHEGKLEAILVARKTSNGWKIGPFYSSTGEIAQSLLSHAISALEQGVLACEAWADNPDTHKVLTENGFKDKFPMTRMWKGTAPVIQQQNSHCMYAVFDSGSG